VRYPTNLDLPPFFPPPATSKDPLPGIVEVWDTRRSAPPHEWWRIQWPGVTVTGLRKLTETLLLHEGIFAGLHIREVRPAVYHMYRWGMRKVPAGNPADVRLIRHAPGRPAAAVTKYRWEDLKPGVAAVYEGVKMATLRGNLDSWLAARGYTWRVRMRYVDGGAAVVATREVSRDAYAQ
jgi:hypothetical protein